MVVEQNLYLHCRTTITLADLTSVHDNADLTAKFCVLCRAIDKADQVTFVVMSDAVVLDNVQVLGIGADLGN